MLRGDCHWDRSAAKEDRDNPQDVAHPFFYPTVDEVQETFWESRKATFLQILRGDFGALQLSGGAYEPRDFRRPLEEEETPKPPSHRNREEKRLEYIRRQLAAGTLDHATAARLLKRKP